MIMRQKLLITGLLIVIGLRAFAQNDVEYEPKFQPQSPQIMAQGGSFTANAKGYNALFMNPAGFSALEPSTEELWGWTSGTQ